MNDKHLKKQDFKFIPIEPDPDFDPEHNRRVIEATIRKNEQYRRQKIREHTSEVDERSSTLATYFQSLQKGGKTSDPVKYFGKKHLAYLRGREVLQKLARHYVFGEQEPKKRQKTV